MWYAVPGSFHIARSRALALGGEGGAALAGVGVEEAPRDPTWLRKA